MARKKIIEKSGQVGIKLSEAERMLILEEPIHIHRKLAEPIRSTPSSAPVMFTLDELEELAGYIAAETNHTKEKKLQRRLDAIFSNIQNVLERNENPPKVTDRPPTIHIFDRLDECLTGSEPLVEPIVAKSEQGEDQQGVRLTDKQRESLLECSELSEALRSKIQQAGSGTQTLGFSRDELDELASEVDLAAYDARTPHKQRLDAVLHKLEALLGAIEDIERSAPREPLPDKTGKIYQFKITLNGSEPPIWRRFQVPDLTLGELHDVIQGVMGWENSHLHQFIVNKNYYGIPDPDQFDLEVADEDGILLSQIASGKKKLRFVYEYDFGDSWEHEVVLERTLEPNPGIRYPLCLEGARACPPEDCGGVWGYGDLLEAIGNPKHPEHREMKAWVGGKFDPERFSVANVNKGLWRSF